MPPESHQRVRQLFDEALERPEAERLPFVETACAGNRTLFEEVERLLRARSASESFLETDPRNTPRIGRYVLRRELGRGAMGVVYDALDPLIGRSVAVKVIRLKAISEPGEIEFLRERLFREARSAGQLFHPGIVIILDVGQDGDSAFIAMERVDGPTLQQVVAAGGPLKTPEALRILHQTAAALDYAHRHGIVHRDIKPANIMLHDQVTVKVADFGIAKIMSAQLTTVTGLVMGTPSYMSPEQIEARPVDGRSDQFSLAVVAYELLTCVRPFEAESMATLAHLIVYGDRPSARAASPALPAGVDQVFQRALARSPDVRFASCREFVAALEAAVNQQPHIIDAATAPKTSVTDKKRPVHRLAYLFSIAALVLALIGAFFLYKYRYLYLPAHAAALKAPPPSVPLKRAPSQPPAAPSAPSMAPASAANVPSTPPASVQPKSLPVVARSAQAHELYDGALAKRRQGELQEAIALFRHAAELGDSEAMAELAESYRDGEGVTQDDSQALEWFRKAADHGNSSAMVSLGGIYFLGQGVEASDEQAVYWFQKAAGRGNPNGIYDLGTMYESGQGVPEDADKAKQLYQKAAQLGNSEAKRRLAKLQTHN